MGGQRGLRSEYRPSVARRARPARGGVDVQTVFNATGSFIPTPRQKRVLSGEMRDNVCEVAKSELF